jgi:hypothetical protein
MNKIRFFLIGLVIFFIGFTITKGCGNNEAESKLTYDNEGKVVSPLEELKKKKKLESENDSFEYLSTFNKLNNYDFKNDNGVKGANLFSECYSFYLSRKTKSNYALLNKNFLNLIAEKQVAYLPILRNNFIATMKEKLWEENIKVVGSNKTITFIGARYASNKLVKDDMDAMTQTLSRLRFKTGNFKWIPSDDDYVTYTINSKPDNVLIQ